MFACRACGECCRRIGDIVATKDVLPVGAVRDAVYAFPYEPLPDGSCPQLQPDNTCASYATRPLLCNVDAMFDAMELPMSRNDWHRLNETACPAP